MTTDILTQLQTEYQQLLTQFFSSFSYLNQRHDLVAPQEIPGLKFTSHNVAPAAAGKEDTELPTSLRDYVQFPLQPEVDNKTFEEAQKELAEDLVFKTRQIQQLIARLPGIDQNEQHQTEEIQMLAGQVEDMERARRAKRKEMRKFVEKLDAVINGNNTSLDYTRG